MTFGLDCTEVIIVDIIDRGVFFQNGSVTKGNFFNMKKKQWQTCTVTNEKNVTT